MQKNVGKPEDGPVRCSRVWQPKVSGGKVAWGLPDLSIKNGWNYTDWFMGILIVAYNNPYITGGFYREMVDIHPPSLTARP